MSLAGADISELEQIKKVLQDPLTDRKVMIPITSKAFVKGSLQPTTVDSQEQVTVKLSKEKFVETSRTEALDLIDQRIRAIKTTTATVAPTPTVEPPPKPAAPNLDYFEIREEYDESGKEVCAEAINVAKQLEFLQRQEQDMLEVSKRTKDSQYQAEESVIVEENTAKTLSDQEYEKLSSRLDELARLEEEVEVKKEINLASAKKLQGSGWAKGFLNKWASKKKVKSDAKEKMEAVEPETLTEKGSKRVAIQEQNNQVKEIPRIGERPVASLKIPPSSPSRPVIESSVFTGIVHEREGSVSETLPSDVGDSAPISRFAQQRQELHNQGEQKKRSKFAQERDRIR
jgi:hypothetical protein